MSQELESDRGEYVLRLRPLRGPGWSTPPLLRLRGVLKRLLRTYGFVAVEVRPVKKANELGDQCSDE
jgi:hypothetical protein